MPYTTREISENLFLVVGSDGAGIKNHLDAPIPPMSALIAEQLCADLNEISETEEYKLNESLVYCMISTMMALPDNRYELSAEPYIHWDRA